MNREHMAENKRFLCQLCGPAVHITLCDNRRRKHSWWKAISQIILPTIRECGGVKWRFHMQMCQWGGPDTLPNRPDPRSPALVCFTWDRTHKESASPSWKGSTSIGLSQASFNHVESKQKLCFKTLIKSPACPLINILSLPPPSPPQPHVSPSVVSLSVAPLFFHRANTNISQAANVGK